MMSTPSWFEALSWSPAVAVEQLRQDRSGIPASSGVYVFTNYLGALQRNTGVLYVGKAKSLAKRLGSYLADPAELQVFSSRTPGRISTSLRHAGKVQLLVEMQQKSRDGRPCGMWLRWTLSASPVALESQLIQYLQPAYNSQGLDTND